VIAVESVTVNIKPALALAEGKFVAPPLIVTTPGAMAFLFITNPVPFRVAISPALSWDCVSPWLAPPVLGRE
jgi:hypothetical protein